MNRLAATALAGAGVMLLVGGAVTLRRPPAVDALGVGLAADDSRAARRAADSMVAGRKAAMLLVANAAVAHGDYEEAIAILQQLAATGPYDPAVEASLDAALEAAGDTQARLARALVEARRSGDPRALRRVAALASAAGSLEYERTALLRLYGAHLASPAELDRLAVLTRQSDGIAGAGSGGGLIGDPSSTQALQRRLQDSIVGGSASLLASLQSELAKRGQPPAVQTLVADLLALGRPAVAAQVAALATAGERPALWPMRMLALRQAQATTEARTLLAQAIRQPGTAAPAHLVSAAYDLDRPFWLIDAAESGAVGRLPPQLTLDLVRRAAKEGRSELVGRIERVAADDWRPADPWLAIQIAEARHDVAGAVQLASLLPPDKAADVREAIATRAGDRALLRSLLLDRAAAYRGSGDLGGRRNVAERLLAAGARDDAAALLQADAAIGEGLGREALDRLLFLWGPRPPRAGLDWLLKRANGASGEADQLAWMALYLPRDRPAKALAAIEASPLGDRTAMLLERLTLAGRAHDAAAANRAVTRLLDGRALSPSELREATARLPGSIGQDQRLALARRRLEAGVPAPTDRMDLAWDARRRGDDAAAARYAKQQVAIAPTDAVALRMMADLTDRGSKEGKSWTRRALAALPDAPENLVSRAQLLARLGRTKEALAAVEAARQDRPDDKGLIALHARLLIQANQPGRAQALFRAR